MIDLKKILIFCFVFLVAAGWIFSGWPRIWNSPRIPPSTQIARADIIDLTVTSCEVNNAADTNCYNAVSADGGTSYALGKNGHIDAPFQTLSASAIASATLYYDSWATLSGTWGIYVKDARDGTTICSIDPAPEDASETTNSVDCSSITTTQLNTGVWLYVVNNDDKSPENVNLDYVRLNIDYTPSANVSVSVSDGVIEYEIMPANTSKSTLPGELNDMQTATNDGNVTENFNIKGQDATGGGCTWTLASSNGSDQYVHQFCNDTNLDCSSPPTNYTALTTSYQPLDTGIAVSGTVDFQLRIITPNPSTCYGEQSVNVTIQAVQP